MSTKPLTLTVPASLAQELDSPSQEFLVELLERGLRELKIERDFHRSIQRWSANGIGQTQLAGSTFPEAESFREG
jgi:hypothetical protein